MTTAAATEKKTEKVTGIMKKITVSGSFRTSPSTDRNRHDFSGVEVIIPNCKEDWIVPHTMRMFPIAKNTNKQLDGKSFNGLIKIYVDGVEEVEGTPDCCGKMLKTLTWEELQSLACVMYMREIPLYRQGSLRAAQEKAYELWQRDVNKRRIFRTVRDISHFKETLRRNLEALMLTNEAVEERVKEEVGKAFSMIVNPQNLQESYNFSKVDDIKIPDYTSLIKLKEAK